MFAMALITNRGGFPSSIRKRWIQFGEQEWFIMLVWGKRPRATPVSPSLLFKIWCALHCIEYRRERASFAESGREHFVAIFDNSAAVLETSRAIFGAVEFVFASSSKICLKVFDLVYFMGIELMSICWNLTLFLACWTIPADQRSDSNLRANSISRFYRLLLFITARYSKDQSHSLHTWSLDTCFFQSDDCRCL